jgi:hypothetical protein
MVKREISLLKAIIGRYKADHSIERKVERTSYNSKRLELSTIDVHYSSQWILFDNPTVVLNFVTTNAGSAMQARQC